MVNGNGKGKAKKLIEKWNAMKEKEVELKKEREDLRKKLIKEVDKVYPNKTRSARLEVGEYNIIRSAVPKIKWDLMKFQDLVGKTLYGQVIKTKVTVDEDKVDEKIKEGKIDKKDIRKICDVQYQDRLLVNLKSDKEKQEETARSFIEDMDF